MDDQTFEKPIEVNASCSSLKEKFLSPRSYTAQYFSYLPTFSAQLTKQHLIKLLQHHGIDYYASNEENCQQQYQCSNEVQLNHSQMIVFTVRISNFCVKLSLLNIKGRNPLLKYKQSQTGNYGKIYYFSLFKETIAIKVFPISNVAHISESINNTIKQYAVMKICSILGCAPQLKKSFGFDILVYDDSAVFCMEKCHPLNDVNNDIVQQLKEHLRTMHLFHIIHYDIKPDNIMLSPYSGKPVFIDFGFSDIVKEQQGEQSLISFRGSPAYCCEQMIQLLGNTQFPGYVDVYYNDMHGLRLSMDHLKREKEREVIGQQMFSDNVVDSITEDDQISHSLLIGLLKYRFLMKEKKQIVQLLKYNDFLLLERNGNEILKIFQSVISPELFESIYGELSKVFHRFIEPNTIQNFLKNHYRAFSFRNKGNEAKQQLENFFQHRSIFSLKEAPKQADFLKYRQFLELENIYSMPIYEEHSRYILLQSLRFDRMNNRLDEKIALSVKFNQAHQLKSVPNLDSIRATFQILFDYCLASPHSNWKKQHIFVILTQLFISDANFDHSLQRFFIVILQMHTSFQDQIICSVELIKLVNLMTFKHLTDHEVMAAVVPYRLYEFGTNLLRKVLHQYEDSDKKQIKSIVNAFNMYLGKKGFNALEETYIKLKQTLIYNVDKKFKHNLLQFFYLQILQLSYDEERYVLTNDLVNAIKELSFYQIFQTKRDTFHYFAYYITRILVRIKNYKDLQFFLLNIIKTINCEEVSSKFKFAMCVFIFSDDLDTAKMKRFTLQLLQYPPSLATIKLNAEFSVHLEKIKSSNEFMRLYPQIIDRLSHQFTALENRLKPEEFLLTSREIQKIMYKFNLVSFFVGASPYFKNVLFKKILDRLQKQISVCEEKSKLQLWYFRFQLENYLTIYYQISGQNQKIFESYEVVFQISRLTNNEKAQNFFLKKMLLRAAQTNHEQRSFLYTYMFYNISANILSFSRYFQIKERRFIALTLYLFELNNDMDRFYNFLAILSKFITKFPYDQNFLQLHENMEKLMETDRKFIVLMNYTALAKQVNNIYWDNHYFVFYFTYSLRVEQNERAKCQIFTKIAENIDLLSIYAKEIILRKYFTFIITYYSASSRKRNYLLIKWGYRYLKKKEFMAHFKEIHQDFSNSWSNFQAAGLAMKKIKAAFAK